MGLKFERKELEVESPRPQFDVPAEQVVEDDTLPDEVSAEEPVRKGRGRHPNSCNCAKCQKRRAEKGIQYRPQAIHYGSQRDRKEVSQRLSNILTGATGLFATIRPHFAMTDEEAQDIAEPLSSYMIRQEQFSPVIREFLDRYDLIAASLAMLTYLARVWREDIEYRRNGGTGNSGSVREPGRPSVVHTTERESEQSEQHGNSNSQPAQTDSSDVPWVSTPLAPGR